MIKAQIFHYFIFVAYNDFFYKSQREKWEKYQPTFRLVLYRPIQYGYHVSRIPYADYRVNELTPIFNGMKENELEPKSRVLRKRYGIKIEFHQAGMLGLCNYI